MKKTAFFLCGFILAPAALSAALVPGEVVASGRLEAQRLDTRAAAVCRISSADELGIYGRHVSKNFWNHLCLA